MVVASLCSMKKTLSKRYGYLGDYSCLQANDETSVCLFHSSECIIFLFYFYYSTNIYSHNMHNYTLKFLLLQVNQFCYCGGC